MKGKSYKFNLFRLFNECKSAAQAELAQAELCYVIPRG